MGVKPEKCFYLFFQAQNFHELVHLIYLPNKQKNQKQTPKNLDLGALGSSQGFVEEYMPGKGVATLEHTESSFTKHINSSGLSGN